MGDVFYAHFELSKVRLEESCSVRVGLDIGEEYLIFRFFKSMWGGRIQWSPRYIKESALKVSYHKVKLYLFKRCLINGNLYVIQVDNIYIWILKKLIEYNNII